MLPVSVLIRNRPDPFLLDAGMSVVEAAEFFRAHHIGGAPVISGGLLVGFLSERDIVFRVVAKQRDTVKTRVSDIMSNPVTTATAEARVDDCERRMRLAHVRHMPIMDGDRVLACISLRDLLRSELRQAETEVRCLSEYVKGTPS